MLRVSVGEFTSGARTSCQFSLWAVANTLLKRSTTKLGSYPKPPVGVTFTGAPNAVVFCADASAKKVMTMKVRKSRRRAGRFEAIRRMGALSGRLVFVLAIPDASRLSRVATGKPGRP